MKPYKNPFKSLESNYVKLPSEIFNLPDLSPTAFRLFCYIASWDECFPGYKQIKEHTGIGSDTTVKGCIDELVARNMIACESGSAFEKGQKRKPNRYSVKLPSEWLSLQKLESSSLQKMECSSLQNMESTNKNTNKNTKQEENEVNNQKEQSMDIEQAITTLETKSLTAWEKEFITSVRNARNTNKKLSPKQESILSKMLLDYSTPIAKSEVQTPKSKLTMSDLITILQKNKEAEAIANAFDKFQRPKDIALFTGKLALEFQKQTPFRVALVAAEIMKIELPEWYIGMETHKESKLANTPKTKD